MKIIIFSPTSTKLTPRSIHERPLGGADQALLRMIDSFKELFDVTAYIPIVKEEIVNSIIYRPFQDLFNIHEDCDILVHYRKCYAIPNTVKAKIKIFYSQDDIDSPCFAGIPDNYFDLYDKIVVLSQYHKERMLSRFTANVDKYVIIGNGATERDITEPKTDMMCVYASTPFRGLVVLAKMWKQIIEWFPEAQLHIFSSMKIYDGELHDQMYFNQLYSKLKNIKGIVYHGSVTQEEVLSYLDKADLLLYPNTFPETYCNVIMESRASMTPFVTSDKGALRETGGSAGLYVTGNPYTEEYQKEFLDKVHALLTNYVLYNELQKNCYPIRTWEDHGSDFQDLVLKISRQRCYDGKNN